MGLQIEYHPRFIELKRVAEETLQHLNRTVSERNQLRASVASLEEALGALGVIGGGYCFCNYDRDPDRRNHEPECLAARAALEERDSG